jgi:hypothetical protein
LVQTNKAVSQAEQIGKFTLEQGSEGTCPVRMVGRGMNQESFSLVAQLSIGDNVRARVSMIAFSSACSAVGTLNLSDLC